MNNDLISRKALLEAYDKAHQGPPGGARKLMEEALAVDAALVVHGKWLERHRKQKSPEGYYYWNAPLKTVFVCSECGKHEDKQEPYCHCGAKMDGGKDG